MYGNQPILVLSKYEELFVVFLLFKSVVSFKWSTYCRPKHKTWLRPEGSTGEYKRWKGELTQKWLEMEYFHWNLSNGMLKLVLSGLF